jgi:hypothetical protein
MVLLPPPGDLTKSNVRNDPTEIPLGLEIHLGPGTLLELGAAVMTGRWSLDLRIRMMAMSLIMIPTVAPIIADRTAIKTEIRGMIAPRDPITAMVRWPWQRLD